MSLVSLLSLVRTIRFMDTIIFNTEIKRVVNNRYSTGKKFTG